jgi:hypothetical protein
MEGRLQALLRDFRWGRMDEIFLQRQAVPVHALVPAPA